MGDPWKHHVKWRMPVTDTRCMALCLRHEPKRQIRRDKKPDWPFPEAVRRRGRRLMGARFLSRVLNSSGIARQWRLHSLKNILKTLICALFKRVNVICCFYFHSMKIMRASFIVCVPFPVPCSSLLQFPGNTCYRNYFYFTHSLRAWIGRNANSDKTLLTSSLR